MGRFADQGTEDIANGLNTRSARSTCPSTLWPLARRKLDIVLRMIATGSVLSGSLKEQKKLKSSTTIKTDIFIPSPRRPTTPGTMLVEEYMKPLGLTQQALADAMGITRVRVNEIINGRRGVTADTALRLARVLGTSVDFWLRLQLACDLYDALHSRKGKTIARLRRITSAA
jgi:antitoxin HigA-1